MMYMFLRGFNQKELRTPVFSSFSFGQLLVAAGRQRGNGLRAPLFVKASRIWFSIVF